MANWSFRATSAGQCLVGCDDTGRTIAVAYNPADGPLIAAAPAMLAAAKAVLALRENIEHETYGVIPELAALAAAVDKAEGRP